MGNIAVHNNQVAPTPIQPIHQKGGQSLDQNKSHLDQAWDQRKIPATSTPEAISFANQIEAKANTAASRAVGVEKGLDAKISDPNFQTAFDSCLQSQGITVSDAQRKEMVEHLAKSMVLDGDKDLSHRDIDRLQSSFKNLEKGAQELKAAQTLASASQVSHPENGQNLKDALDQGDGHHAMIQAAIHGAKVAEEQVRIQAQRIEEKLALINDATALERLLTQYKHLDSVDLSSPSKDQEKTPGDFARIDTLRRKLEPYGLEWKEGAWTSKGDLESIIQGVRYVIQGLTSQNSTMQIELQGKHAAATQYLLIASTMMRTLADLMKEIGRNIRG